MRNAANQVLLTAEKDFEKLAQADSAIPFPETGVPLVLTPTPQDAGADVDWPISTGIPMPRGALASANRLMLLENGAEVPAQFTARTTWQPGSDSDVKWVGLDFLARTRGGHGSAYRLMRLPSGRDAGSYSTALKVTSTTADVTIDTGPARFVVKRQGFAGISSAWLDLNLDGVFSDTERVIDGEGGPTFVDQAGAIYAALHDSTAEVVVEEQGPTKATLRASGWYAKKDDPASKLCLFLVRITAYAGLPYVRVSHRTVVTYNTRSATRLANVGFQVRAATATTTATATATAPFHARVPRAFWELVVQSLKRREHPLRARQPARRLSRHADVVAERRVCAPAGNPAGVARMHDAGPRARRRRAVCFSVSRGSEEIWGSRIGALDGLGSDLKRRTGNTISTVRRNR